MADIKSALTESAVVTLVGIGGAGKTRLAREVARSLRDDPEFNGSAVWVDFTAIDDAGLVDLTFVSSTGLGAADRPTALDSAGLLAAALGDEECLLVLDNAEHVNDGVADLAHRLAVHCRQAKVLVTSRDRLGVDAERVIVVSPLPTPPATATDEVCAENDAVRLLTHLVGPATDPRVAGRLVRAVGGLPLGVELIASMSRHVPLADLAASLEQALPGLALDRPGYQPRQRLSAVFAHAIDRLAPADRNLLALLSGFTAPFMLLSAERLAAAGAPGLELDSPVVASLIRLVESGLVQVEPGEPQRYSLTPLQTAAANRLLDDAQRDAIRTNGEAWYKQFAAEQGRRLRGHGQLEALRLIDAEFGNLLAVSYALVQSGRPRDSLAITGALADYWPLGRNPSIGLQLLADGLAADDPEDSPERLRALVALPFAASTFAGLARHEAASRAAAAMAARLGRRDLEDEALLAVGVAEAWTGRHAEAFETLGRVAASSSNRWAAATAQLGRSLMFLLAGQVDEAERGVHTVARQLRAAGDRIGEATAFMHLAVGLQRHGDSVDAEAATQRSLELASDEMQFVTMHCRYVLGLVLGERQDPAGAGLLTEVRTHFRQVGDLSCLNGVNRALADIARRGGDDEAALELMRETVWLLPDVDQQETAASLVQIAEIYLDRGLRHQAGVLVSAAERLVGGSGIGWNARQRQRLSDVLEGSGGDGVGVRPISEVIGVALHA